MIGAAAIFLVGECVGLVLFAIVRGILSQNFDIERKLLEIFKGALERLVITTGLVLNFPQILIMFAALKLANRLKHEGDDDEMRNYFLIGNLISVLMCFVYFYLIGQYGDSVGAFLAGLARGGADG